MYKFFITKLFCPGIDSKLNVGCFTPPISISAITLEYLFLSVFWKSVTSSTTFVGVSITGCPFISDKNTGNLELIGI